MSVFQQPANDHVATANDRFRLDWDRHGPIPRDCYRPHRSFDQLQVE